MEVVKKFKHQQPTDDILVSNLQRLMAEKGISEAELSRQTNIPQPTLHKIFSGATSDPRISTLKTLADYFHITLDALYNGSTYKPVAAHSDSQRIPIIEWDQCSPSVRQAATAYADQHVSIGQAHHANLFGLSSRACMEPRFLRGTILIANPMLIPADGDLVIVQYPNIADATVRVLSIDGPHQLLLPLNGFNHSEVLTDDIAILGVIIQAMYFYK